MLIKSRAEVFGALMFSVTKHCIEGYLLGLEQRVDGSEIHGDGQVAKLCKFNRNALDIEYLRANALLALLDLWTRSFSELLWRRWKNREMKRRCRPNRPSSAKLAIEGELQRQNKLESEVNRGISSAYWANALQ